ncbi:hypothetical protein [Paraburkholderia sacchari]|uniref:hypothetical protein n=1 Tax=Paraburkholderia sacchari TaxID=159450 RepID=UPI00054402C3|nr:hypothetical protein [Paraburkholderia sacchari]NLP61787.1 hypothetical protein [Paraburkholderia sacchari]
MLSFQIVCAAVAAIAVTASAGAAESLVQGSTAPADVVQQLKGVKPVTVGAVSVRPVSQGSGSAQSTGSAAASGNMKAQAQSMPTGGETTTVVRASDNLVGVSANDLVVVYRDTAAVSQALSGKPVTVKAWPSMGLVIVHASTFDQLAPLQAALSEKFPTAKFDLPVKYFNPTLK